MKKIFFFLALLFVIKAKSQDLKIQSGASLITSGKVALLLNNVNFIDNGTTKLDSATLIFTGDALNGFKANSTVGQLVINKTNNVVTLNTNVKVSSLVNMQNGLLDLSGKVLLLTNNAVVNGETERSHIIGPSGGTIETDCDLSHASNTNPGNLGLVISTSANTGVVHIKRGHIQQTGVGLNGTINRYFDVIPMHNKGLNATVQFTFLNAELNNQNRNNLSLVESTGNNNNWVIKNTAATTTNAVIVKNLISLNRYTLAADNRVAPAVKTVFNNSSNLAKTTAALNVWPVPAITYINLSVHGVDRTPVQIFDVSGKMIRQVITADDQIIIINNLIPGAYFIKVPGYSDLNRKVTVQ